MPRRHKSLRLLSSAAAISHKPISGRGVKWDGIGAEVIYAEDSLSVWLQGRYRKILLICPTNKNDLEMPSQLWLAVHFCTNVATSLLSENINGTAF